ncbi:hydrogenase maturation protease [Thalassovita gelatinovora]|uniref:Hydrogenase maturation protease n=1 Tax=Thalassovita gelatinovora TaxID=53501 RepID=A0A0P1FIA8_THAGE|nr:hydrogenase maturation protease [Thalassovita gelatinovora]QIZ82051.1 hydrogenase maturation protease [Thalassovita gelatinovora]CUH67552.1 hydrogenase maturation protease [Thalassovita gelatinovora]SEP71951.1 hydrogenase maturation protease [Thalassovita gelatinovora]
MLLIGYGNPGRGDDGLGPAFADLIEQAALPGITVMIDYQLTVDHALAVADTDLVVFADAQIAGEGAFGLTAAAPVRSAEITSHALTPEAVLTLARTLYAATPDAFILGITGQDFGEVKEGLSPQAQQNLDAAVMFFRDWATG